LSAILHLIATIHLHIQNTINYSVEFFYTCFYTQVPLQLHFVCSVLCTVIILQIAQHHGIVVAVRNNTTIKEFSELQDLCFSLNLTLIPIVNVSELPQLLVQMVCNIFILYFRSCVMEMNMQIYCSFLIIKPTRCTNFSNLFFK